jgi:AraC-like DNA-binding protein
MNKKPKLMDFSTMHNIFEPHLDEIRKKIYFSKELGIIHGNSKFFKLIVKQNPPFAIDDHRLGIILRGQAVMNLNLVEKHLEAGTIVFLGPGSVITPLSISDDLEIIGLALFSQYSMPFAPDQMPASFNGQVRDTQIKVDKGDFEATRAIFEALWMLLRLPNHNPQAVSSLVAALMHHYDGLFNRQATRQKATQTRGQTIFDRFIYLVNRHAQVHHQIGFCAAQMCITERYLGTIIKQTSGVTAKEWVDRALITRMKIELRHTDKTVAQISDELNFPNSAFCCKFFKRITGVSPMQFRHS